MRPSQSLSGHLAALFTITVWGVTFISIKVLLVPFSPVEIMFYRLVLAVLALNLVSRPSLAHLRIDRNFWRAEWKLMAAGLCGVTLYFLFQNLALSYTLAANVSVLVSVAPLLTALASRAFLGQRLKPNFVLGFSIAIAGIGLIAFNGAQALRLNPLGDLLSILAALSWAFYSVLIKKISAQGASVLAMTRTVFGYGLLFMLPALPLFEFRFGLERLLDLSNLLHLAFLGLGGSALCFFTWNYAVHQLGPVQTSVYIYLVPLVTIVASALVLAERISLVAGVGIGMILIGMGVSEWEKKSKPQMDAGKQTADKRGF
jgi:drug/metabolite transporter (DMT)-like permease